jgi:hypothetical protein
MAIVWKVEKCLKGKSPLADMCYLKVAGRRNLLILSQTASNAARI